MFVDFSAYWQKIRYYLSMHTSLKGILLLVDAPAFKKIWKHIQIFIKGNESHATLWIFPNRFLFHYCAINPTLRILLHIPLQEKLNICLWDYYISVKMMIMSLEKLGGVSNETIFTLKENIFYFKWYTTNYPISIQSHKVASLAGPPVYW